MPRPLGAQEGGTEVEVQDRAALSRAKYFLQLADICRKKKELLEYVTSQLESNGLKHETTEDGKGVIVSATSERLLRQVSLYTADLLLVVEELSSVLHSNET